MSKGKMFVISGASGVGKSTVLKQVKQSAPDAVLIFIMPPSREELERRLRSRGDTSEEQIKMRLERASWEMEQRSWYDYTVVNDDAKRCAEEILTIIANLAD